MQVLCPPYGTPVFAADGSEPPGLLGRLFSKVWWIFFSGLTRNVNALPGMLQYGTNAARLALAVTDQPDGALFVETDRNELVYQVQSGAWVFVSGTYQRTQSQLTALAALLGTADAGLIVSVTDYAHQLSWTGTAWQWGPSDTLDAGQICFFDVAPTGNGWKLIDGKGDDGSAIGAGHPIAIMKSDGTTRNNITAAAMNANVYVRGAAAYAGAVTAATAPTLAGATASGAAVIGNDSDAGVNVTTGAGNNVALRPHTHTDSGHTHAVGTLTTSLAGGDPVAYTAALPYIRK